MKRQAPLSPVVACGIALFVFAACGPQVPVPTAPTPDSVAVSLPPLPSPNLDDDHFWVADSPLRLPARAFGVLRRDVAPGPALSVARLEFAAPTISVPAEIDVFIAGDYAPDYGERLAHFVKDPAAWQFTPNYSLVQYVGPPERLPPTGLPAADAATGLLRSSGLLRPDSLPATSRPEVSGSTRIFFYRRVNGFTFYANKALGVSIDRAGFLFNVIGRRRPLVAASRYPTRGIQEAWADLVNNKGRTFYIDDGGPLTPETLDRFVVTSVEIAYAELEVVSARDVVQPYFVFRDAAGRTIWSPAVEAAFTSRS